MILRENAAQLRRGAVAIIGRGFDDDGDASGSVALVNNFFQRGGIAAFAGAALDRALDVVVRHALTARGLDRATQTRIRVGIAAADLGRDCNFFCELAENLAALGVNRALEALYLRPFAVSGHE